MKKKKDKCCLPAVMLRPHTIRFFYAFTHRIKMGILTFVHDCINWINIFRLHNFTAILFTLSIYQTHPSIFPIIFDIFHFVLLMCPSLKMRIISLDLRDLSPSLWFRGAHLTWTTYNISCMVCRKCSDLAFTWMFHSESEHSVKFLNYPEPHWWPPVECEL